MLRYGACSQRISQFYLHTHTFIRNRNEPYLPLPPQPQLVLIYRPRRDGRLSRCEVTQAEIRTCNLPIANPALYHTATSAPTCVKSVSQLVLQVFICTVSQQQIKLGLSNLAWRFIVVTARDLMGFGDQMVKGQAYRVTKCQNHFRHAATLLVELKV